MRTHKGKNKGANSSAINLSPRILILGTIDTKCAEIGFLKDRVQALGGQAVLMDVGVLGKSSQLLADFDNRAVAAAAGCSLEEVAATGDENSAMQLMAKGAAALTLKLYYDKKIDGMLALGGTMGTDLALEVASALPLGVPKVVLSTVAFSHLLPPDRIPPDLIMALWAGGLYGLNSLCRSALSQAAGAVVGACQAARPPQFEKPLVGMTSLGSSALKYMLVLAPELEARGYELAVFHTTGMGGRAFEALAADGKFVAVMDFSLQELVNQMADSCVTSGPNRLLGAGRAGVPQLIAPGATDMVDYQAWAVTPARFKGQPTHEHNRLLASVTINMDMRREVARAIAERLAQATGPTTLFLPVYGIEEWDRPGAALHDAQALDAFNDEMRRCVPKNVQLVELNAHINDAQFVSAVLRVFDQWRADGIVQ